MALSYKPSLVICPRQGSIPWTPIWTARMMIAMFAIISVCKGGGYRYCRTDPPHPHRNARGLYPLHRVLVENRIGRLLEPGEHVHHKDHDRTNDDVGNLELTTHSAHARHHKVSHAPDPVEVPCGHCGKTLSMRPCDLRRRLSRSASGLLFCDLVCSRQRQLSACAAVSVRVS